MVGKQINFSREFHQEIIIKTQNQKICNKKNTKNNQANKLLSNGHLIPNFDVISLIFQKLETLLIHDLL